MQKKTVLLTGAAGAVGREAMTELVRRLDRYEVKAIELPTRSNRRCLRQYEDKVHIVWGDIRCLEDVAEAVEDVDVIIHLAAIIPPLADFDPPYAESVNVGGTRMLLAAAQRSPRTPRFIYTSSISIYGDRVADPWIEVGDPINPSPYDEYALTKIKAEELVQASGLDWTIFRLTAVMSPEMGVDPLMFHMPLGTALEIVTCRDCGYAVVEAIEEKELDGRIFNLGGGPKCRTSYRECLDNVLGRAGLGQAFLPGDAFADGNFHCGYYRDSDELESYLGFQREGLEDFYRQVGERVHRTARLAATMGRPLIRWWLLRSSEPWQARRRRDGALLERFGCCAPER